MEANVDLIGKEGGIGEVAAVGGFNVNTKRPWIGTDGQTYITNFKGGDASQPENYESIKVNTTGTLRRDEWKALDDTVVQIAEKRLVGINDLVSRGLVYNLGNGFATTVLEHHDMSDALEAELSMDAITRAKGDRVVFGTNYLPIPIIHADYEINERVLQASRNMGNGLDTSMAARAARKVAEKLETMLFTETSYTYGNGTIYSYLNYPSRIPGSLGANWDSTGYTGADILADVLAMKQAAIDNFRYGPYVLYVPTAYETILDGDFSTAKGTNTIRERLLQVSGISAVTVVDTLTANNVLLVQMDSETVRLVRGMAIQNVQWQAEGGFVNKFKVMTIQVPQIRTSQGQLTGVVHYT
jgi:hypothetical protein